MWLPVCLPVQRIPSEKGSILKGKNLLPFEANSFLLDYTHFRREGKIIDRVALKVYPLPINVKYFTGYAVREDKVSTGMYDLYMHREGHICAVMSVVRVWALHFFKAYTVQWLSRWSMFVLTRELFSRCCLFVHIKPPWNLQSPLLCTNHFYRCLCMIGDHLLSACLWSNKLLDKRAYSINIFLIFVWKHLLWVHFRSVLQRHFWLVLIPCFHWEIRKIWILFGCYNQKLHCHC